MVFVLGYTQRIKGDFIMILSFDKIKEITLGAFETSVSDGLMYFDRFSEGQREHYKNIWKDFYDRTFCTSGIKLSFATDSKTLGLDVSVPLASGRNYFAFDVVSDGKLIGSIDNYSECDMSGIYCYREYELGDFKKEFYLGDGTKNVCIYFPWSARGVIRELSLDDGSFVEPVIPSKKIIMYGDSITQGYDALNPSMTYAERFCSMMGAQIFNKGIGGAKFFPEVATEGDGFMPDLITVAYGTNDWSNELDYDTLYSNCKAFFANLTGLYKGTPIFAITPIWRKDYTMEKPFGDFLNIPSCIRKATEEYSNIKVIEGFDFVPHDELLYADRNLHPNNEGFSHHCQNLFNAISKEL